MQWRLIGVLLVCFHGGLGDAVAKGRVDINTATAEELDEQLLHIGARKAEAIVKYRQEHGPFKNPQDLAAIKGIKRKTIEQNQDIIEMSESTPSARKARAHNNLKSGD